MTPKLTHPLADSIQILHKNGVDPYVFIRFLHLMAKALIPIWILSWAVLLPVNTVGMNTGRTGLDQFTSGNITTDRTQRYWAHLIMDYVFVCELDTTGSDDGGGDDRCRG